MSLPHDFLLRIKNNDLTLTFQDLSYQNLTTSDIRYLVSTLTQNSFLTSLDLTGNAFGDEGAILLAANTSLLSLTLQGTQITQKGAESLAENTTLKSLDLSQNLVGNTGATLLAQNVTLTSLKLAGNQITPLGVQAFALNTKLKFLDLSENQLNTIGVIAISPIQNLTTLLLGSNQIGDSAVIALAMNSGITTLDLHHNNITSIGAKALAENKQLTNLNLNYNRLGIEGASIIAQSPSITSLSLAGNDINNVGIIELSRHPLLKVLDIAYNQIFDEGAKAFTENDTITTLFLDHNQLTKESANYLADHPVLEVLSLSYNNLGDEGACALARSKSITYIDLTGNNVGSKGAENLSHNLVLRKLLMSYNNIDDAGAIALAQSTSLVELYLSYNQIGDNGALALSKNHSLHTLHLNYNLMSEVGRKVLLDRDSLNLRVLFSEQLPDFSTENLRTIFLLTQDLLCIRGTDDIIQFFNPTFSRVLGYKDDELLGLPLRNLLHPDDRAREWKESSDELLKFPISQRAYRYRHKDGSYRFIQWSSQMKYRRIYASGIDITEQQQATSKLARAELRSELALIQTTEASIYSHQLSEFIAHLCHEVRNPLSGIVGSVEGIQDAVQILLPWLNSLRSLSSSHAMEQADIAMIKIIETNLIGLQGPVTIWREWMSDLRLLLSPLALHEVSEALAKISECASDTQLCTDHEEVILNENLEIMKMAENKLQLENVPFDLKNAIFEVTRMLKARVVKKGVEFNVYLPAEDVWIKGDPTRIKQIVINLVSNAIKFTHHGRVDVTLEIQQQTGSYTQVEIRITDTGIGLTQEEIGKLFQRFTQANATVGEQYGGTGLGLAIAKNLAHLMNGNISIESEKGFGSVFHCVIRCNNLTEQEQADLLTTYSPPKELEVIAKPPRKLTILVVDDNSLNRKILSAILSKVEHRCILAVDGRDAVTQYTECHFDMILMDIMMPVLNGLEATREIRAYEREKQLPHIPIIAITGNALDEQRKEAIEAGMDAYLAKPFKQTQVLALISAFADAVPVPPPSPADRAVKPIFQDKMGSLPIFLKAGAPLKIWVDKLRRNDLYAHLDPISTKLRAFDIMMLRPIKKLRTKASATGWLIYSVIGKDENWAILDFEKQQYADKLLRAVEMSDSKISCQCIKSDFRFSVSLIFLKDSELIDSIKLLLPLIGKEEK